MDHNDLIVTLMANNVASGMGVIEAAEHTARHVSDDVDYILSVWKEQQ